MEVVRLADAPYYTLPGHEQVVARRLQGGEASSAGFAVIGHSTFRVGAVIPMDAGPIDKIYIVIEGVIAVEEADGTAHNLAAGDSILIAAGEARAVRNLGNELAAMIVITPAPAS